MPANLKRLLAVGTAAAVAALGFVPAPAVAAQPTQITLPALTPASAAGRAATWLKNHPATLDDGYGGQVASALGLAVLDKAQTAATVRARVAALQADAATETAGKPGTAATLAILVRIMHLNPRSFGGTNLIQVINDGTATDGQVGAFGSAYGQALAIIALKRSGEPVPAAIVTKMLSFQATTGTNAGAFGYEYGGFVADPDSTGLAIQALRLVGANTYATQIAAAVAWAKRVQTTKGYWESWSPVDSTSLLASSLSKSSLAYGKARTWLVRNQLAGGGFPAALGGTDANLLATSNATFLLAGRSMAKASYSLRGYTKSPQPRVSGVRKVGRTLTAKVGTWSPKPSFQYQWYRSGKKISGATAQTYLLTADDLGTRIRVRVTGSGIGLKTVYRFSTPTAVIKQA